MAAIKDIPVQPFVQVAGVGKSFGDKTALHDISFAIPAGQICGPLGPNGGGKTTLFRLLMGILKPAQGSLQLDGLETFNDRVAVMRRIGFLPDEPNVYAYLAWRGSVRMS